MSDSFYVEFGEPTVLFKSDERTAKLLNREFNDRHVILCVCIFYKLKDLQRFICCQWISSYKFFI